MDLLIRPFRTTDVDALAEIAVLSFAEEYEARGQTADSFARQIRMATRGRMIPFKLFTRLAGYKWAIFVAEVNGRIVGCGGYLGRKQVELANLMVHPDYRRRGIGQVPLSPTYRPCCTKPKPG
jgi:ribosomal protein S18 acetylase RimI-like enzyme